YLRLTGALTNKHPMDRSLALSRSGVVLLISIHEWDLCFDEIKSFLFTIRLRHKADTVFDGGHDEYHQPGNQK
ncbi:MAG: hypothetical protein ABF641_02585, partial [Acetobacter sp.]